MDRLVKFSKIIKHLSSIEILFETLSLTLKSFGIDYICYFVLSPAIQGQEKPYLHVFGNFPSEWADYYFANQFYEIDPIIRYARCAVEPFHWFSLNKLTKLSEKETEYLQKLYAAGYTDGISIPVYAPLGQVSIFGFSAQNREITLTSDDIDTLKYICVAVHERYIKLTEDEFHETPALSEREKEVLFWVAQGKSDIAISSILGLSENTIDTYIRRIFKRLNVSNRITACVRAVCLGIMLPHH